MIRSIQELSGYYAGIHKRTLNYVRVIPPDQINWSPRSGEYTCADIIRHIAAGKKMFVGVATGGRWKYDGHSGDQATLDELITYLEQAHTVVMQSLQSLRDSELEQPRPALEGNVQIKVWRWLMAMIEHEIHHRSQLAMYLMLLGITPPHIYGLSVEDLIAKATG